MPRKKEHKSYRYCFVPFCKSTTISTTNKRFFSVPQRDGIREKWFNTCRRKHGAKSSAFYCCENHFNLETDVNMVQHQLTGRSLKLKEGVLPSKFDCQTEREISRFSKKRRLRIKERKKIMCHIVDSCSTIDVKKKPKFIKKEYNFDLEVEPRMRMTPVTTLDMIVLMDPTTFITPDIESSNILGPEPLPGIEPDSSMMEQNIRMAMTCETYPVDSPQPDLQIKIKEEPLDPDTYVPDILSVSVKQEPDDFSGESSLKGNCGSLFQPPVLIKEEPVSLEEES